MRIVFFGSPPSALPCLKNILKAGHTVELVITQPDRPSGRGKKLTPSAVKAFARVQGIPCFQPPSIKNNAAAVEKIKRVRPDLNVVVAYGQIIPSSIIYLPPYNSVNVHFSLLPKYRGASPVQWAILKGEKKTGVTIFELNHKMDEGDILSQQEVAIRPGESAGELMDRLAEKGAQLLLETLANIDKIKPLQQDHSQATYAPRLRKKDGKICWEKDALSIERQVRALNPWPSAFTFIDGKRIKILRGEKVHAEVHKPHLPGEILSLRKEGIEVYCGKGSVFLIQNLQPENRNPMNAYSFSLGGKIKVGSVLC
ncbi:MAG: methionyl-tRNA formyltransferase [Candidatus Aminicenantes bacterium]